MKNNPNGGNMPRLLDTLVVLAFTMVLIGLAVLKFGVDVHIPIIFAIGFTAFVATWRLKTPWSVIAKGLEKGAAIGLQAIFILCIIGMLMGAWIKGGIVPSMIYYGLSILSPKFFLLASLIICSIVSLATGSSWGTSGTIGIALMGIGAGLGIPAPMCAGIIISGAYFGDKMSPFSDTTNLAPAVAGTTLYSHIRSMFYSTAPSYIIVCVIALFLGFKYGNGTLDTDKIQAIQQVMAGEFYISPITFIAPLVVITLAVLKKPVLPGIFAGALVGAIFCLAQGTSFGDLVSVMHYGYKTAFSAQLAGAESIEAATKLLTANGITGLNPQVAMDAAKLVAKLLSRGGTHSMMWTISLTIIALGYGGVLEVCGFLEVLLDSTVKGVKSAAGMITSTIGASIFTNLLLGSQYLAIVLPGRMFKPAYEEKGLHPRLLSRTLEDSGTMTSVLIPWNVCGGYHAAVLGVATLSYAPYAFLNWITPIVAIVIAFMGFGIFYRNEGDQDILEE